MMTRMTMTWTKELDGRLSSRSDTGTYADSAELARPIRSLSTFASKLA